METSARGISFLERHEGVVLKAYRDPVGVWTIGAGLTAASGVVVPKPRMVITKGEASTLLKRALKGNYEPAVLAAMPDASQQAFDGGVSFHWNTGAIGRASWVGHWKARNWGSVRTSLLFWSKAKGKVLPGLKRRREEEFRLIRDGQYGVAADETPAPGLARHVAVMSAENVVELRAGLKALGYDPGPDVIGVSRTTIIDFQRDHDLTIDGIIGRATLSTLQRRLDAKKKTRLATGGAAVSATETQTDAIASAVDSAAFPAWLGWLALVACLLWLIWLAWSYRDALAAKINDRFPALANFLRSF